MSYKIDFFHVDAKGVRTFKARAATAHFSVMEPFENGLRAALFERPDGSNPDTVSLEVELKDSAEDVAGLPGPFPQGSWDYQMTMEHLDSSGGKISSVDLHTAHFAKMPPPKSGKVAITLSDKTQPGASPALHLSLRDA